MIDDVTRSSQDDLLRQAAAVLRTRCRFGDGYPGVSPGDAEDVAAVLEAAVDSPGGDGTDRDQAVALAHRLVDDDQPESSPLWPDPRG
jgi:hypothetical protein